MSQRSGIGRHSATLAGDFYVTKEQQRPSSLVGDLYIAAEQRGAATSTSTTSTLVVDHYVAEEQQGPVASATMSDGEDIGQRKPLSTSTPGDASTVLM